MVNLSSVFDVGYAMLGVDDENFVAGLRVCPVGAARLVETYIEAWVGGCAGVRAGDFLAVQFFLLRGV